MSPFRRLALVAGVIAVVLVPLVARSGEEDEDTRDAKPGPNHERLAALAGDWEVTTGLSKGEGPATETKGAATIRSVLGGRFIVEEQTGTIAGEAFTSWRLTGFNNLSNAYEATWTYTGSSAQMHLSGSANADGTKFTMAGGVAVAGGKTDRYEVTVEFSGPDRFLVTLHGETGGWVSTYVRKK
jgi:uncharacterized protein DUF1579